MEKKRTTNNHIDIYDYLNPSTHSFCLSLYIKAGALYESDQDNGITHFWEHVLFRNINHLMGGKMYEEIDKLGLYFNGATYKEFVQLYIIGAPEHFAEAADVLLKVFAPLTLPATEIKTEQQRVKAEIREAEDFKSLDYFAGTFAWKDTSLRNTILGTKGNVSSFNRKKMAAYHQDILTPQNLFFYVTGNVTDEQIGQLASKVEALELNGVEISRLHGSTKFDSVSKCVEVGDDTEAHQSTSSDGVCTGAHQNLAAIPTNFGKRDLLINVKNSQYTMVNYSFDLVTSKYTYAELALLYDILFSGENALLHQELSEKRGMIYSFSSTLEKYSNIGRLFFVYEVAMRDLYESVEITTSELARLSETVEQRLPLVLPDYIDNAYFVYDDNEGFNWQRAYENHIMDGTSMTIEETKAEFLAVTPERIKEMAAEIFTRDNLVLSLKADKKKLDLEKLRSSVLL